MVAIQSKRVDTCPSCSKEPPIVPGPTTRIHCRCGSVWVVKTTTERFTKMTQKIERWAFTEKELLDPSKCKREDEFVALLPAGNEHEYNPLVERTGKCTDRWEDGCVGVPQECIDLLEGAMDTLYTLDHEDSTSEWRDVVTDDEGLFIRFYETEILERFARSNAPIVGMCLCKTCRAGAVVVVARSGQAMAFCRRDDCIEYGGYDVRPVPPCEWVPV